MESKIYSSGDIREIYFAAGCFWGTEKLFQSIDGIIGTKCGYANGRTDTVPDYELVCTGCTGYRETVKVTYDRSRISLSQLLKAYFLVIDPTVEKRQGNDIGDQYQTGIYYTDDETAAAVEKYAEQEKLRYEHFAVETGRLTVFYPAEEYHQNYLIKNPGGYCHIRPQKISEVVRVIGTEK